MLAWAESRADAYRWPRAMLYLPVATFSFFVLGLPGFVSYFPAVILLFLQVLSAAPGDRKVQEHFLKQLHRLNTIGLVTTHDLELGELEKEYKGSIYNYHFTDEIRDNEIHFDYRMKPGIAQTANAVTLMKLVGIAVKE